MVTKCVIKSLNKLAKWSVTQINSPLMLYITQTKFIIIKRRRIDDEEKGNTKTKKKIKIKKKQERNFPAYMKRDIFFHKLFPKHCIFWKSS